jgi:hypothetical protein
MSSHIKAGVAHKKLKTYLAYLTRLRQAVGHIFLLEGVLKDNFTLEDFNYLRAKLGKIGGKTPMHRQLAYWLQLEYEVDMGGNGEDESFGKSRFGYQFDMDEQLQEMEASKSMEDVTCRLCYDTPVDPTITEVSAITGGVFIFLTTLNHSADTPSARSALPAHSNSRQPARPATSCCLKSAP